MKFGGSISFQLVDIFNIMEDESLTEEQKRVKSTEYQKPLIQEGSEILYENCKRKIF